MISRRSFLKLLGLAPAVALLPKALEVTAPVQDQTLIAYSHSKQKYWGTADLADNMVTAIYIEQDGTVFVGGNFTNVGGVESDHIASYSSIGGWHRLTDAGREFVNSPYSLYDKYE